VRSQELVSYAGSLEQSGKEKMKNRKPETENGKPEIGPDRFSFPVSCFPFPVFRFLFSVSFLFGSGSSGLGARLYG
jgi:hypothetical protein